MVLDGRAPGGNDGGATLLKHILRKSKYKSRSIVLQRTTYLDDEINQLKGSALLYHGHGQHIIYSLV